MMQPYFESYCNHSDNRNYTAQHISLGMIWFKGGIPRQKAGINDVSHELS
jgi:hypothetical protein